MTPDIQKAAKGFFQRPEGKTGLLFLVAGIVAAGWGLYLALPFIIVLLTNTLHAMALAAAIALVVFLVSDKRVRALAGYGFKSLMRLVTGLIVEIDPIGILRGYVEDLRARLADMDKSRSNLRGQLKKLKKIIEDNAQRREMSLRTAKEANGKADMKPAFILHSRQAGRLAKSNMTLQALHNKMENMDRVLSKMRDTSEFLVHDIEAEVEVKTQERAAIQASYGAFTSARQIIQGESDQKAIFDQAMEHLADDYAMKVGEIELFMEMSEGFIKSVDLENGVYEQDALEQFEKWEQKADQILTSPVERRIAVPGSADDEAIAEEEADEADAVGRRGSYSDLFK
jgi:hypothetical protein